MPVAPPLIGRYKSLAVLKGEQVTCLFRKAACVVTSTSTALIKWPRVRALTSRGGSGLWVNEALVKAIRTESAAALRHWFGVTAGVVWRWRKVFGVGGRATTKGCRKAIQKAAKLGAEAVKAKVWTPAELAAKSAISKRLGLKPTGRWKGRGWTPEQVALLGTDHDEAIAKRIGRSRSAVTTQRVKRGLPAFSGSPGGGRAWMAEEVALLGTASDQEVADRIGRTLSAVQNKRYSLKGSDPKQEGDGQRL